MEENTKGSGLVATIFILIVIILFLGGFILYDKVLNNTTETCNTNENNVNTNTNNDNYKVLELSPIGGIAVVYNNEVYVNIYDSTKKIDEVYGDGKYQTLLSSREKYQEYKLGNLEVETGYVSDDNNTKWLKIDATGVKSIYNNQYGQDVSSVDSKYGIILLNNDSTVSYISIEDLIEGKTSSTSLNVSDISSIVTENNDGLTTYLISSNGTKTDVNTLIK